MDFHLTKEQLLVRKMYREFAENEVKPLAAENYRNAFVTLFMAAVFSSDCTESDTGPSNCSRYLLLQISE